MDSKAPTAASLRPSWAGALTDPAAFAREQHQLGKLWTVLGLTTDIPNDNDWFRATLGGCSVFVQRFGEKIRGFENRCAHRFYPLRIAGKGNGVIRCGFHHWQYNKDGRAVGIPQCQKLFGVTPRELNARLNPVEIATCGMLIFGRFAAPEASETLEQYLGDGFPILQALCNRTTAPYTMRRTVKANWKLCLHISLDDYHIVAVHPSTFGKEGYLSRDRIGYFRFGRHNAFLNATRESDALKAMAAACRDGTYMPPTYRIIQFFPNFAANHTRIVDRWFVTLHLYIPLAVDRTLWQFWFYPAPFPIEDRGWLRNLRYRFMAPGLPMGVRFFGGRVADEDKEACEKLQTIAAQGVGLSPVLGRLEERIAWFEDAYAQAMDAQAMPA